MNFDTLRRLAPTNYKAWPDLLKSMGWDVSEVNEHPEFDGMTFILEDDSGAEIRVFVLPFLWSGDSDDTMATNYFSKVEHLSVLHGDCSILVLNKFVCLFDFDALPGHTFSECGRFYTKEKGCFWWTDVYFTKNSKIGVLYDQARQSKIDGDDYIPDASLADGGEISHHICELQGKAMRGE